MDIQENRRGLSTAGTASAEIVSGPIDTAGVRIDLTVRDSAGDRDIALLAPDSAQATEVRAVLIMATGAGKRGLKTFEPAALRSGMVVDYVADPPDGGRPGSGRGEYGSGAPHGSGRTLAVVGGPCAGITAPLRAGRITVGRGSECELRLPDPRLSRRHATVDVRNGRVSVQDLSSTNGSAIEGAALLGHGRELETGAVLRVGDSLLSVDAERAQQRAAVAEQPGCLVLHRPPRALRATRPVVVDVPTSVAHRSIRATGLLAILAPALLGGALAWFTGSVQFLLFTLAGPLMVLPGSVGARLRARRERRAAAAGQERALGRSASDVTAALRAECADRRAAAPDPAYTEHAAGLPSVRVWERGAEDADFLTLRLGTATVPSETRVRCGGSERAAGTIPHAPVTADLRAGPLGIAGPEQARRAMGRWLLCQAAVWRSPAALQLALVIGGDDSSWHWARWLPHLAHRTATTAEELPMLLASLGRAPTLLLIDEPAAVRGWPGAGALFDAGPNVATVFLAEDARTFPPGCRQVAAVRDPCGNRAELTPLQPSSGKSSLEFLADQVTVGWADRVARALAPLRDAAQRDPDENPPNLGDLLGVETDPRDHRHASARIAELWRRSDGIPTTVLGRATSRTNLRAGRQVGETEAPDALEIDLATDGPHCLIAGTTGSGKSVLLRTLVAGLALRHPPSELTFLLIDYKGGAAFADCARLPHTAGLVTDLDAQLTRRALRSLGAELRRRERLLAANGAGDIAELRRKGMVLPRLVVVIDEFATLADDLPDFVTGLVGIAQRGRSLGLHLVLATQRPGRAVSPEIRANVSLRIALRMTDAAESLDVLDAPDAADIPAGSPGSAYLRRQDGLTGFRAAVSALAAVSEVRVEPLGRWRRRVQAPEQQHADAGLPDLVDTVRATAAAEKIASARSPWLAPLPAQLPSPVPASAGPRTMLPVGLVDRPDDQAQTPLYLDLARCQSMLVCGTSGSGRTNGLVAAARSAALRLATDELELYAVDRSGALPAALAALPQLCTAVPARDHSLVATLLRRLLDLSNPASDEPAALPVHRMLLLDDWDAVVSSAGDAAGARLQELLSELLGGAADRALSILISGDRGLLSPRMSASVDLKVLLRLADRADYVLAGIRPGDVPRAMPPGRGVCAEDAAEIQFYRQPDAPETARATQHWADTPTRRAAIRLRPLPDRVALADCRRPPGAACLGVGVEGGTEIGVDLLAVGHFVIAGPPRSGRSTALLTVLDECRRAKHPVIVAAPARSPLHARARSTGTRLIDCFESADTVGPEPAVPTVLLVDDCSAFDDTETGELLASWLKPSAGLRAVVAGGASEIAGCYRGVAAQARRHRAGLLLRPAAHDGELFGIRLERGAEPPAQPGRGVLVGVDHVRYQPSPPADSGGTGSWTPVPAGEPVPIQVAAP